MCLALPPAPTTSIHPSIHPSSSDADSLVEFAPDAHAGLNEYFGAKAALEQLLGRGVDLVESAAVRNPYVLASINRHRQALYAVQALLDELNQQKS